MQRFSTEQEIERVISGVKKETGERVTRLELICGGDPDVPEDDDPLDLLGQLTPTECMGIKRWEE